jgi:hypothetical protein
VGEAQIFKITVDSSQVKADEWPMSKTNDGTLRSIEKQADIKLR